MRLISPSRVCFDRDSYWGAISLSRSRPTGFCFTFLSLAQLRWGNHGAVSVGTWRAGGVSPPQAGKPWQGDDRARAETSGTPESKAGGACVAFLLLLSAGRKNVQTTSFPTFPCLSPQSQVSLCSFTVSV